jgi:hypothetical protein
MPKIQWTDLPLALRDHLFDRVRERKITADDLYQLKLWRKSEPEAPEGLWYKGGARAGAMGGGRVGSPRWLRICSISGDGPG